MKISVRSIFSLCYGAAALCLTIGNPLIVDAQNSSEMLEALGGDEYYRDFFNDSLADDPIMQTCLLDGLEFRQEQGYSELLASSTANEKEALCMDLEGIWLSLPDNSLAFICADREDISMVDFRIPGFQFCMPSTEECNNITTLDLVQTSVETKAAMIGVVCVSYSPESSRGTVMDSSWVLTFLFVASSVFFLLLLE